jgi:hypothetical protein
METANQTSKPNLEQIQIVPKHGEEPFHAGTDTLGFSLRDFWQWAVSDLLCNLMRGHLAEFIVGKAIGSPGTVRNEWAAYDLQTPNGTKIEVKSAAYLQSWAQDGYSQIQFNVEKTKALDSEKGGYRGEPRRCADVYVFAVLAHKDKPTVDPLNVNQWEFYVLPAKTLNERTRSQHSITLKSLIELSGGAVGYFKLAERIRSLEAAPKA